MCSALAKSIIDGFDIISIALLARTFAASSVPFYPIDVAPKAAAIILTPIRLFSCPE